MFDVISIALALSLTTSGSYDESETDDPTAGTVNRLKLQQPFTLHRTVIQVSDFMREAAQGGVGDIWADQVQKRSDDLFRDINSNLFGTAAGFTVGGAILGLRYLIDDSTNYTTFSK